MYRNFLQKGAFRKLKLPILKVLVILLAGLSLANGRNKYLAVWQALQTQFGVNKSFLILVKELIFWNFHPGGEGAKYRLF